MRTQEARAVEGLADILRKLLDRAEDEGMDIYNDKKTRRALLRLRNDIMNWGLE
jgi:hypothetical protein